MEITEALQKSAMLVRGCTGRAMDEATTLAWTTLLGDGTWRPEEVWAATVLATNTPAEFGIQPAHIIEIIQKRRYQHSQGTFGEDRMGYGWVSTPEILKLIGGGDVARLS